MPDQPDILAKTRGPSRLRKLLGVEVISTGSFTPDNIVRNEELAAQGYDAEWILQRTGIRERRKAPPEMATSDLAVAAAENCISQAGITRSEIDLVIVATFTGDVPVPSTACLVQDRLGLDAAAMDLQSACAGFMYALITGMQYVATGSSRLALVIGADCNSRIVNPQDMKIYPLFGDGAGAVLLRAGSSEQGLPAFVLGADGSGAELLYRPMGGSRMPTTLAGVADNLHLLRMDGKAVFKWAIRLIEDTTREVLAQAGLTTSDIDLVVLHQANIRIINAAIDQLGIDHSKVFNNLEYFGNTSAGSVPLALDQAHRAGRIHRGDHILLSGYGAGLAWGTAVLKW